MEELRDWLDGYDPAAEREWAAVAQERIRQIALSIKPFDDDEFLAAVYQAMDSAT